MRDKRKTRTKDLVRRHQSGAQECAASYLLRRIGVLVNLSAGDPQAQVRNAALLQGLQALWWSPFLHSTHVTTSVHRANRYASSTATVRNGTMADRDS